MCHDTSRRSGRATSHEPLGSLISSVLASRRLGRSRRRDTGFCGDCDDSTGTELERMTLPDSHQRDRAIRSCAQLDDLSRRRSQLRCWRCSIPRERRQCRVAAVMCGLTTPDGSRRAGRLSHFLALDVAAWRRPDHLSMNRGEILASSELATISPSSRSHRRPAGRLHE